MIADILNGLNESNIPLMLIFIICLKLGFYDLLRELFYNAKQVPTSERKSLLLYNFSEFSAPWVLETYKSNPNKYRLGCILLFTVFGILSFLLLFLGV